MIFRGAAAKYSNLSVLAVLLVGGSVVGCTTTPRSINESPRDPQVERQSPQPSSTRATQQTRQSRTSQAQTLSATQMNRLVQTEVDQLLQRGVTSSQQVVQIFGQPHSMTRSGDELYWNYTHQFRDERRNVGGLKSLTILFDQAGRVQDYDFQDNSFALD